MAHRVLIQHADLVTPESVTTADLLIEDGYISQIAAHIPKEAADECIEARGLTVLPGVIDSHVHFRDPGDTHKEDMNSGARAALAGGVTTVIDMPNTRPPVVDQASLDAKHARARAREAASAKLRIEFLAGATADNVAFVSSLKGARGVKLFLAPSNDALFVTDAADLDVLFRSGRGVIAVHAEDPDIIDQNTRALKRAPRMSDHDRIRDPRAAVSALQKVVPLAVTYQRPLHVLHVSSIEELAYLKAHKQRGPISAEVTPHHLFLAAPDAYAALGTRAKTNPPIRGRAHGAALWQALLDGLIDTIGSDHAPHTMEEKNRPYASAPAGVPGVETTLPLMLEQVYQKKCALTQVVKWLCENPARVYGFDDRGAIRIGLRADLVLVDLQESKTVTNGALRTKAHWSPFDTWRLHGWPKLTIVDGSVISSSS